MCNCWSAATFFEIPLIVTPRCHHSCYKSIHSTSMQQVSNAKEVTKCDKVKPIFLFHIWRQPLGNIYQMTRPNTSFFAWMQYNCKIQHWLVSKDCLTPCGQLDLHWCYGGGGADQPDWDHDLGWASWCLSMAMSLQAGWCYGKLQCRYVLLVPIIFGSWVSTTDSVDFTRLHSLFGRQLLDRVDIK